MLVLIPFELFLTINQLLIQSTILTNAVKLHRPYVLTFLHYTKIPHNKLIRVLNELIEFCFERVDKEYIFANKYGVRWSEYNANNSAKFTKSLLEKTLKHLLGYYYFKLGNTIFRQAIGVAMGSDQTFFIANLLLYYNKNTSIRRIKIKKI